MIKMISNGTGNIEKSIPVQKPLTSLKGFVVTPEMQKSMIKEETLDLFEICDKKEIMNKFDQYTFPELLKMDSGEIFFNPHKSVRDTTTAFCIKWLVFDKDFNPIHGHDYPMVRLPLECYLMKIVIPLMTEMINDFGIEYLIDIRNIDIIRNETQSITEEQFSDATVLRIRPFDFESFPKIKELMDDKLLFFRRYVKDAIE